MKESASPFQLCKKLTGYFPKEASEHAIYQYLKMHGMYRTMTENILDRLPKNVWEQVEREYQYLQKRWDGPQVPVFIFPADETNFKIKRELNGKSGLAFSDKLFLFYSPHNTSGEIKAVFTHEYNHVCRLKKYQKNEADYTLLDTVILEGIAENAVREHCGETNVAGWTKYYPDEQLNKMIEELIIPNRYLNRNDRKHTDLLYGRGFYPKMIGYCVGYYLVRKYLEKHETSSRIVLPVDAQEFIKNYL